MITKEDDPQEVPNTHHDVEELIVQEVRDENPPEDVGLRDEWKDHTGWHRKEVILMGRPMVHSSTHKNIHGLSGRTPPPLSAPPIPSRSVH